METIITSFLVRGEDYRMMFVSFFHIILLFVKRWRYSVVCEGFDGRELDFLFVVHQNAGIWEHNSVYIVLSIL